MAETPEFIGDVTRQMAEQVVDQLAAVQGALEQSRFVVDHTVALQRDATGLELTELDVTHLTPVAEALAAVVGQGVGMLHLLQEAGAIEFVESDGTFALATPVSGELTAGEAGAEDDATGDSDGEAGGADDADGDERVLEVSEEVRTRQERILTGLFPDREDEIEQLTQAQMVYLGKVAQALYLQVPVGPRGKAGQPERADQFADVLAGLEAEVLEDKYGQSVTNIRINLIRAAETTIPNSIPKADLNKLFDQSLAQQALQATEQA